MRDWFGRGFGWVCVWESYGILVSVVVLFRGYSSGVWLGRNWKGGIEIVVSGILEVGGGVWGCFGLCELGNELLICVVVFSRFVRSCY